MFIRCRRGRIRGGAGGRVAGASLSGGGPLAARRGCRTRGYWLKKAKQYCGKASRMTFDSKPRSNMSTAQSSLC